jgi:hypothetical protein
VASYDPLALMLSTRTVLLDLEPAILGDPAFAIDWPAAPAVMADADRNWPDFG